MTKKTAAAVCENCEAIKSRRVFGQRRCQDCGKWWHGEAAPSCSCGAMGEIIETTTKNKGPRPRIQNGGVVGEFQQGVKCGECGVISLVSVVRGRVRP